MKKTTGLFIILVSVLCSNTYGQANNQIKEVFKKFQEGYAKRDTAIVEKFTTDLFAKDIIIVGTGEDEWYQGISDAKSLIKNDWAYWLTLSLDTANIDITTSDNAAFFMVRGTVSMTFPSKEVAYDFAI